MLNLLYILLGISILAPIYTYFIYPHTLKFFQKKDFRVESGYMPNISLIITSSGDDVIDKDSYYAFYPKEKTEIYTAHSIKFFYDYIDKSSGDIIVVVDSIVTVKEDTIRKLIAALYDDRVGCTSGQVRRRPGPNGEHTEGLSWRYEHFVKKQESSIGQLSGATSAIYAIKRKALPSCYITKIEPSFYLATHAVLNGYDCLYVESAEVYGSETEDGKAIFKKHIEDGTKQVHAMAHFWKLLFPRKGSFVYVSHRLMKWLVPFNLLLLLLGSLYLSFSSAIAAFFFSLQILVYTYVLVFRNKFSSSATLIGMLTSVLCYFLELNIAWLIGAFRALYK